MPRLSLNIFGKNTVDGGVFFLLYHIKKYVILLWSINGDTKFDHFGSSSVCTWFLHGKSYLFSFVNQKVIWEVDF